MFRRQSSRTAVVGIAIAVFVVCCVLPIGYLVVSISGIDASAALMLDARQRRLLFNTALLGLGTALLATAIGAPMGLALARISLRRTALLRLALAAPVLLPPHRFTQALASAAGKGVLASDSPAEQRPS